MGSMGAGGPGNEQKKDRDGKAHTVDRRTHTLWRLGVWGLGAPKPAVQRSMIQGLSGAIPETPASIRQG